MESGIPFGTTYHPKVKELWKLIRDLLPFLHSDGEVQKFFSPPPIVSYRSARKIKDYVVISKLYPVERKVGCQGCDSSRCQVCKSISITEEFTSFTTKITYEINHSFNCNDKSLIYLLSCKPCGKQFVVAPPTILEKLRVVTLKMWNKSFCKVIFLQRDHQGFLKDKEARLIDKSAGFWSHQKGVLLDKNT